jgi:hypothetical protein
MQFLKCTLAVLIAAPIFGSAGNPDGGLTVHEWGTFTTVSDRAGGSAPWSPLGAPADLPCFVEHLNGGQYKALITQPNPASSSQTVTVRMETPVLYFYSPRKTTVSVGVDFPKGLITEWYPSTSRVRPGRGLNLPPIGDGHIEWNPLQILPGETATLPQGQGSSHYYAARNADANLVRLGTQSEKMLFYRGVANFEVPVSARVTGQHSFELRNTGDDPLALAVLFENRGGQIGYRVLHSFSGTTSLQEPELNANLDALKHQLSEALVAQGLLRKEADAMIETWRDSWFEEGMRVFYLVPRTLVDRELPLSIQPAPAKMARVFVGREEILSPYLRDRLVSALSTADTKTLDQFGRFLQPFRLQVKAKEAWGTQAYIVSKQEATMKEFYNPTCVR